MDFRFDDEEKELVAQAGRALRKYLPAGRMMNAQPAGDAWRCLGKEGWLHAGLPERLGGGDLPLELVAAIGREAGRVLAGDAFVDNAVILPRLAGGTGAPEWAADVLANPGFVLGPGQEPAAREPVACFGVEPGLSAYRLGRGTVERFGPDGWTFEPLGGFGVTSGSVRIRAGQRAAAACPLVDDLSEILRDAAIVHAASLIGLGECAMADTVEHVKIREQFGGPIGRFQAVKHALADVSVGLEVAWNAVLYAALKPGLDTVSIAHLQASRAADQAARTMIQLFGGIAMTWEHHAHWYVKVIETSRHRFGSTAKHALELADLFQTGSVA
jgi:alkylation response protein AidB-like acyl-CoA dehydrogenase